MVLVIWAHVTRRFGDGIFRDAGQCGTNPISSDVTRVVDQCMAKAKGTVTDMVVINVAEHVCMTKIES